MDCLKKILFKFVNHDVFVKLRDPFEQGLELLQHYLAFDRLRKIKFVEHIGVDGLDDVCHHFDLAAGLLRLLLHPINRLRVDEYLLRYRIYQLLDLHLSESLLVIVIVIKCKVRNPLKHLKSEFGSLDVEIDRDSTYDDQPTHRSLKPFDQTITPHAALLCPCFFSFAFVHDLQNFWVDLDFVCKEEFLTPFIFF